MLRSPPVHGVLVRAGEFSSFEELLALCEPLPLGHTGLGVAEAVQLQELWEQNATRFKVRPRFSCGWSKGG